MRIMYSDQMYKEFSITKKRSRTRRLLRDAIAQRYLRATRKIAVETLTEMPQ